jgi:hypothetical protein
MLSGGRLRRCIAMATLIATVLTFVRLLESDALGNTAAPQAGGSAATSPFADALAKMNHYRALEHLNPLTEEPTLSQDAAKHARYVVENKLGPGNLRIDGDQVKSEPSPMVHNEEVGNPWYSVAGASVAGSSDVFTAAAVPSDLRPWIDRLMTSPRTALMVLEPTLVSIGYGEYCASGSCAAVVVYNTNQSTPEFWREFKLTAASPSQYEYYRYGSGDRVRIYLKWPIQFPPPDGSFPLGSYDGGRESDDPLSPCAGYKAPTGLPIVLSLGQGLNDTAAIKLESYSLMEGAQQLESCGYDAFSYTNQNPQVQQTGRNLLRLRLAAVVIPREPLEAGHTYTVSMTADSKEYKWSFKIGPGGS